MKRVDRVTESIAALSERPDMKWFKNRNTTTKLLIPFGGMALLAALVGDQGIQGMVVR